MINIVSTKYIIYVEISRYRCNRPHTILFMDKETRKINTSIMNNNNHTKNNSKTAYNIMRILKNISEEDNLKEFTKSFKNINLFYTWIISQDYKCFLKCQNSKK